MKRFLRNRKSVVCRQVCLLGLLITANSCIHPIKETEPFTGSPSSLWGTTGETWDPLGRLPYFAKAGYRGGEPIPTVPVTANVRDFGAVGDGITDDTAAILKAIEETEQGAVLLPEGRYLITAPLRITKSNLVLRGEGPDKTVLVIPKSREQLDIERVGKAESRYTFGGGFVEIVGTTGAPGNTTVVASAQRGEEWLEVASVERLAPGNWIRLLQRNEKSLGRWLHVGEHPMSQDAFGRKYFVDWVAQVAEVDGARIRLDRPLRFDVRLEWDPQVRDSTATVSDSGVEGLAFAFPGVPKKAHLFEEGFNGVFFFNVEHCWARDIRVTDGDLGVMLSRSRFCTVEGIDIRSDKRLGLDEYGFPGTGHHALWLTGFSQDNLVQDFRIDTTYHHDLTVETFANGNVFRNGWGRALNLDHHCLAPYENLFTNLATTDLSRIWLSSGRRDRHPHAAARNTVWNIKAESGTLNYRFDENVPLPPDWPEFNIIGLKQAEGLTPSGSVWLEALPEGVWPEDLYAAQRKAFGLD
jgi:hypothetical protein